MQPNIGAEMQRLMNEMGAAMAAGTSPPVLDAAAPPAPVVPAGTLPEVRPFDGPAWGTVGQLAELTTLFERFPCLWPNVDICISRIYWNGKPRYWGGFAYLHESNQQLQVLHQPETAPLDFLRLLLHEMGHACFERMILRDRLLCPALVKGDPDAEPGQNGQISSLSELSLPTQAFYNAWAVLRVEDGAGLLGVDLGLPPRDATQKEPMDPAARQRYQADDFREFCAEVFMLYVMGDVASHLARVREEWPVGSSRRQAWEFVGIFLDHYAGPLLYEDLRHDLFFLAVPQDPKDLFATS